MKVSAFVTRAFLAFVLSFAVCLQARSDEPLATAQRLVIRSGLSVQLRGFAQQTEQQLKAQPNLDPAMAAALSGAAREAFRADALEADVVARVARKLTVGDMKKAIAWLDGESGQRITRAEEEASSAAWDDQRFRAHVEQLKKNPSAAARIGLLTDLMAATNAVAAVAAAQEAIGLGVAVGINSLQPAERRVSEGELRRRLREVLPLAKVHAALNEQLPLVYSYVYRDIPNGDLAGYVAFLKTPSGARYQDAMNAAYGEALARASVRIGELVAQRGQAL